MDLHWCLQEIKQSSLHCLDSLWENMKLWISGLKHVEGDQHGFGWSGRLCQKSAQFVLPSALFQFQIEIEIL
jgi:hypothetical protein